jgi:hypothetical protein
MFFLANTSLSDDIPVRAEFKVDNTLTPWVWNPECGERQRYPIKSGNNRIELILPRATSLLIVFENKTDGEQYKPVELKAGGKEITGPWNLKLHHMNGDRQQMKLDVLADLTEIQSSKNFAGTIFYEKTLEIDRGDFRHIDLGNVQGITELTLNGEPLGTKWYGAHVYDIGTAVKQGENMLNIKLTTITGNYLKSLKDNQVAQRWTGNQPSYPMGILGPVRIVQ